MKERNIDVLKDIRECLRDIRDAITGGDTKDENGETCILISCDASITQNPGGQVAVGAVIQTPGKEDIEISQFTPSETVNEGELDAIYVALTALHNLNPVPEYKIVIYSDSQVAVNAINIEGKDVKAQNLVRKRDLIRNLLSMMETEVEVKWKPRNSTAALRRADNLATSLNQTKRSQEA